MLQQRQTTRWQSTSSTMYRTYLWIWSPGQAATCRRVRAAEMSDRAVSTACARVARVLVQDTLCWVLASCGPNNINRRGPLTHALRSPTTPAEHRRRRRRRRCRLVLSCLSERDGHGSRFPFPSDFARETPTSSFIVAQLGGRSSLLHRPRSTDAVYLSLTHSR